MVADGGTQHHEPSHGVRVAGREIGEADIAREMQHHPAADPRESRHAALQALVVRELLRLEIERRGICPDVQPQESEEEAAIRTLLDVALSVPELQEQDCRRFFEANRDRFRAPDRTEVHHILLAAAPPDMQARMAARDEAQRLIAEICEHPQRFNDLAARFSVCPSRESGGSLGWLENGQTTPEFERQVLHLEPGLCPLPVETRYGFHVVRVDASTRGAQLPYEEVRERIAARLEVQVRQSEIQHFLVELNERFGVEGLEEHAQPGLEMPPVS
ncbi:MAG: peptidylprolyl isomerase [Pseudomonadales bacterium]|nr:peptidylprolyl isomerase [Pseudomonadales bacterium]